MLILALVHPKTGNIYPHALGAVTVWLLFFFASSAAILANSAWIILLSSSNSSNCSCNSFSSSVKFETKDCFWLTDEAS